MLIDTRKETSENKTGFNPKVQNQELRPKHNVGFIILDIILGFITIIISWWFFIV